MKNNIKIFLISLFFLLIFYFIFETNFIKFLALGSNHYFGDYKIVLNAMQCYEQGLSPYIGPSELNCKGFNYGHIILVITPLKNFLFNFYLNILPIILISIFTLLIIKIINPRNSFHYFLCFLSLLNPATLLLIERMNLDILLVIIIIFISFNRVFFVNWLLVIFSFLFKFYPFTYGLIIFVEKTKRKKLSLFLIFLFIFITSLIFLYIYKEEYSLMLKDSGAWKMGLHYLFSIKTLAKILKEGFNFHYGLILLTIYLSFIILMIKKIRKIKFSDLNLNFFTFEKKLFLLSANTLLFCFIVFSNAFYREVFLILTLPYLLKNAHEKEFQFILYIFIFKFLFNFLYIYTLNFETFYYLENLRVYKLQFLLITSIKGLADYIIMLYIGSLAMKMNLDIIKYYKERISY